jgi:uncharacterized RDD family membrane protein YckC
MEETEKKPIEETYHFAGFWWRLLAYLFDAVLIALFNSTFINPLLAWAGVRFPQVSILQMSEMQRENPFLSPLEIMGVSLRDFFILQIVSMIIYWLYFAFMESSKKQATVGKLLLGMVVTDTEGAPVSFAKASARAFSKYLSAVILLFGFIMAGFTEKRQALHDMIAGCLVLKKD